MDIDDEHEHDDLTDDSNEANYRERATALIDRIAQQAKQALSNAGIDIDLFFTVPSSGDAILTFGTPADPANDVWDKVRAVVSSVVRDSVGIERTRCRDIVCASTHNVPAT